MYANANFLRNVGEIRDFPHYEDKLDETGIKESDKKGMLKKQRK